MVFGFLLYVPNPLCTGSTLPKPQTLMPCCREPTFSSSFLLFPLTLGISHSSLNWECTLSFLSKHQNKMWSLYAVEMATRAAGLGHVLHAVIKKKKNPDTMQKELTMYSDGGGGNREDVAFSHTCRSMLICARNRAHLHCLCFHHHYVSIIDWRAPPLWVKITLSWMDIITSQHNPLSIFLSALLVKTCSYLIFFYALSSNTKVREGLKVYFFPALVSLVRIWWYNILTFSC